MRKKPFCKKIVLTVTEDDYTFLQKQADINNQLITEYLRDLIKCNQEEAQMVKHNFY